MVIDILQGYTAEHFMELAQQLLQMVLAHQGLVMQLFILIPTLIVILLFKVRVQG